MAAAKWYLTTDGRAEFAAKVAARDECPYQRCNRLANEATQQKQAEATNWWQDAYKWIGLEVDHDPTMVEAIARIAGQCPNYQDARTTHEVTRVNWQNEWRGVDWRQLSDLVEESQSKVKINWIVQRDKKKKKQKRGKKAEDAAAVVVEQAFERVENELTPVLE